MPFDDHIYVTTAPIFTKCSWMLRPMILIHLTDLSYIFKRQEVKVFIAGHMFMNIVPSIFTVTKILSHGQNLIYITLAIQNGLHEIRGGKF